MIRYFISFLILVMSVQLLAQIPKKNMIQQYEQDSATRVWLEERRIERAARLTIRMAELDSIDPMSLISLDLSNLGLTTWPALRDFPEVTRIIANDNEIILLPVDLRSSPKLNTLILTGNQIKRLRLKAGDSLRSIDLGDNNLRKIPRSLRKMKNLRRLVLNNNNIKRIPNWIKKLHQLDEVDLNFNQLKLTKRSIKALANVHIIQLGGNDFEKLPDNMGELTHVRKLNLGKNRLCHLPPSFAKLDSLNSLILYQNQFTEIDHSIFSLCNLRELDLYYNSLDSIPLAMGSMSQIERLFLAFNRISYIPDTLQHLKNLRWLYIHHNELTLVPGWTTSLSGLEIIDISYNHLIDIPDLSVITPLYEIDIQHNDIEYFPWKLLDKKNLRLLIARENPFILDAKSKEELEERISILYNKGIQVIM